MDNSGTHACLPNTGLELLEIMCMYVNKSDQIIIIFQVSTMDNNILLKMYSWVAKTQYF